MSSRIFSSVLAGLFLLTLLGTLSAVNADEHGRKVLERFGNSVAQDPGLSAAQKESVAAKLKESMEDPQYAVTDALVVLFPKFGDAIDSSDSDQIEEAIAVLKPMTKSKNQYLAADSSFVLARMLMNNERFEEAMPLLQSLTGDLGEFSANRGVAQYFIGVAHAGLLDQKAAIDSFMKFIQFNPDAPERLIVSAWQRVQELQAIKPGQLDDVYQRMDFSRRRLALQETDDTTQEQQDKIVKMLNKLIKEAEKKECSNCKGGKPDKSTPKPGQKSAQSKPSQSKSSKGGSSSNPNGKAIVKNYDDSPASPWSRLRDRSRDPANNAVKEKLPAGYREIVERFIKAANGEK